MCLETIAAFEGWREEENKSTQVPCRGVLPQLPDLPKADLTSQPLLPGTLPAPTVESVHYPLFIPIQNLQAQTWDPLSVFSGTLPFPLPSCLFSLQSWSLVIWPGAHLLQFRLEEAHSTHPVCSPADSSRNSIQFISMRRGVPGAPALLPFPNLRKWERWHWAKAWAP